MKIGNIVSLGRKAEIVASVEVTTVTSEVSARCHRWQLGLNSLKGCIVLQGVVLSAIQREELAAIVVAKMETACKAYGPEAVTRLSRCLGTVAHWARQYGFRARLAGNRVVVFSGRRSASVKSVVGDGNRQQILRILAEKAATLAAIKAEISAKVEEVRTGLLSKKISIKEDKKGRVKAFFGLDRNGLVQLGGEFSF